MESDKVIDNTASIKQILKEFTQRHAYSQAYKFYNLLMIPRSLVNILVPHHVMLGHPIKNFSEDWHGDINYDYFEPFPYRCTMPKVITSIKNMDKTDPVTDYIKTKTDWAYYCRMMKQKANCKYLFVTFISCNRVISSLRE
jgi:hypothetical protein